MAENKNTTDDKNTARRGRKPAEGVVLRIRIPEGTLATLQEIRWQERHESIEDAARAAIVAYAGSAGVTVE